MLGQRSSRDHEEWDNHHNLAAIERITEEKIS